MATSDLIILLFYFFAGIVIWLGILSLRSGFAFASYVRCKTNLPTYTPFVSVIAPNRGLDQGLRQNIVSLFKQQYPEYEIIFVVDRSDDPSLVLLQEIANSETRETSARVVIAGEAIDSGQKVHNLRAAIADADPRSEVIVFVDTDARTHAGWLRSLVAPLQDEGLGATTGYRWFIPSSGGFASHLRSVWNASIASALGARSDKNFCWGGSTAMRRSTFEKLRIRERWRGTVSDDFTITRVLGEGKLPIKFVPDCLIPSVDECTVRELFEFTNRQLKITRVYAPHLWRPLLIGSLLFTAVFFGGIVMVVARAILGLSYMTPLVLLIVIYALGAAKAYLRLRAIAAVVRDRHGWQSLPAHLVLWPIASALYLCNALTAAFSRRIRWRGITYDLKSPTESLIVARESN